MLLLIKLISRYLSYNDTDSLCRYWKLNNADRTIVFTFYFNETMYLTDLDKLNIVNNTISHPLWMRLYHRELLLEKILSNEFLNSKLKVQIYNGIKNNIPSFLKLYHKYFPLIIEDSVELWSDMCKIIPFLPLTLGSYKFFINDMGEFIISMDGCCIGRNFFGDTIKIIKHYGIEHIINVLKSPLIMESFTMCVKPQTSIHRRPKIKRIKLI